MMTLIDCVAKATLLLLLGFALSLLWRRSSAAQRHLLWVCTLASLLVLPAMMRALPGWGVLPAAKTIQVAPPAPANDRPAALAPAAAKMDSAEIMPAPPSRLPSPGTILLALYLAGAILCLTPLAGSILSLIRLQKKTRALQSPEWRTLADELQRTLRLASPVTLLQSDAPLMPMTWALPRPMVLLPADAASWTADRRRCVLLHELAHAKRRDCIALLLARVVCAMYWFHPLVWLAAARLRTLAEFAADDLVLRAGTRGSTYAEELVAVAGTWKRAAFPGAAAIAMAHSARHTHLHARIGAILDAGRNRATITAVSSGLALAATIALLVPLACAQPHTPPATAPAAATQPDPLNAKVQAWIDDAFKHHPPRDVSSYKTIEFGPVKKTSEGNLAIRWKVEMVIWDRDIYLNNVILTFSPEGKVVSRSDLPGFPQKIGAVAKKPRDPLPEKKIDASLRACIETFFKQNYVDITARKTLDFGKPEKLSDGNWAITYHYRATIWNKDHILENKRFVFSNTGEFVSVKNVEGFPQKDTAPPATAPRAP
jgi:beta-lactamase regulating signal transducer with metallopeptidase domain